MQTISSIYLPRLQIFRQNLFTGSASFTFSQRKQLQAYRDQQGLYHTLLQPSVHYQQLRRKFQAAQECLSPYQATPQVTAVIPESRFKGATIQVPQNGSSNLRSFSTSPIFHQSSTMASDADYAAFLDKVNQPTSSVEPSAHSSKFTSKTVDSSVDVPKSLTKGLENVFYTSDTDEEFEEVGLKFDGQKLDEETFSSLLSSPAGQVTTLTPSEFDPRGSYKQVIENVEAVTKDGVKIFRVESSATRIEYWIVGISQDGKAVLGLRAKAVES